MNWTSTIRLASVTDLAPAILDRLAHEDNAWMCVVRPNGSPHLTPVWFVFGTDRWWICSSERSRKVRYMRGNPRLSLALEDGVAPVVAEGRAIVHHDGFPATVVAAFKDKYHGWDITTPFERGGSRVLIEVRVTRWLLDGQAQ
jgi:F420H(2)-dependent biliverdin reductase